MTSDAPAPAAETPFGARLGGHLGALARLAWPVMLSRAGILALTLADIAAVGRHSVSGLTNLGIALTIFIPAMVAGVGFMQGVVSVVARRQGAGDFDEAVATWRRGLAWGLAVGLAASAAIWFSESLLALLGQSAELSSGGGAVGRALALGALAQVLFLVCAFFLEASGRPMPSLVAMALGNAVNIALNAAVVESWGATGVAAATTAARFAMLFALFAWVLADPRVRAALRRLPSGSFWGPGGWAAGAEFRAIGMAGGAANFVETAAFAALAQFAGLIGPTTLAVYTIANSVQSTIFMAALGLAVATGVRVGAELGAGRPREAAFAGWTGLGAAMALMLAIGLAIHAFAPAVAAFYTTDATVAALVGPLLLVVAAMLVFDGGQVVLAQCARAIGDTWVTASLLFVAFLLVMVPSAWVFGAAMELGALGLYYGAILGCVAAVALVGLRFGHLMRRRTA